MLNTNKIEVVGFIESLSLPSIAKGILRTDDDCQSFYIGYYRKNKHVADDLFDYREMKIEEAKVDLSTFLQKCEENEIQEVFEDTFLQSFSLIDMDIINDAIEKGRASLESIFASFVENPNKNIMKNVL